MEFKSYPKIHRLGKEETDGILDGVFTVQEKIDGANVSIWLNSDGKVRCGSRSRELPDDESFNGFVQYVKDNQAIETWLKQNPDHTLFGEWLVKHTITYPESAYKKIYLYDIYDNTEERFYSQPSVKEVADVLGLEYPQVFATDVQLTEEQIKEFVGKTLVPEAANGEGVVIKRQDFKDKWGNHCYAKIVHEKFKESNAIVFGGNNKHSDAYWEMYIVNKYCTLGRVQKIMQKLQPEIDKRLDMEHTPQIIGRCIHDMITEEAWEIFSKVPIVDNKRLKNLSTKKYVQIYHDILNNSLSIADQKEEL